jgi:membrane fusion protein (multidrug efflux system)
MAEMAPNGPEADSDEQARRTRQKRFKIFGAVLVVAALVGGGFWLFTRNSETTDDAFIEADVVPIAPRVSGTVAALHFTDNQWVEQGALLIEIDPRDAAAQLAAARANLDVALAQQQTAAADLALSKVTTEAAVAEGRNALDQAQQQVAAARQQADAAQADAERAAADVKRYEMLFQNAVASRQRLDQAIADARSTNARWRAAQLAATAAEAQTLQSQARLDDAHAAPQRLAMKEAQLAVTQAQAAQAAAAVQTAELTLSYTTIFAPQAGRMTRRAVRQGDVVQPNQTLAALVVDPPWVIANFKETQLAHMRPGQPVTLKVDAFPGHRFSGRVQSIQAGTGSRFSLLPAENATGNYVKVVQRVPVKIVFDSLADGMVHQLAPGLSVVPDVDVGTDPGPK